MPPAPYPPLQPSSGFVCPICHFQGMPIQRKQMSTAGWIFTFALLIICLPLFWLPFVLDGCKDIVVNCPSCGGRFG